MITDNHIGDWGTQFGMIIYGYKHFLDSESYEKNPVGELARLYQLVNQFVQYHRGVAKLPILEKQQLDLAGKITTLREELDEQENTKKSQQKQLRRLENQRSQTDTEMQAISKQKNSIEKDPAKNKLLAVHPTIDHDVLLETAKLHAGDEENKQLWDMFMPLYIEGI